MAVSELEHFSKIHRLVSQLVEVNSTTSSRVFDPVIVEKVAEYICETTLNAQSSEYDLNLISKQDTFSLLKSCEERISKRCNDPNFSQFLHLFNQLRDFSFTNRLLRFLLLVSDETNPKSHPIKLIDTPNILHPISDPPSLTLDSIHCGYITPSSTSVLEHSLDESPSRSPENIIVSSNKCDSLAVNLEESDFVAGLLDILKGGDTSVFTLTRLSSAHTNSFVVKPSSQIPPSLLNLCLRVGELGCCFSQIQIQLEEMSSSPSIFSSSLVTAVRSHLEEYSEYISLFPQLQTGPHTLRHLLLFVLDPMYSMKRICSLLEKWKGERGRALVNIVYKATSTGCPKMRRILSSFLKGVLVPLQSLLHRWVYLGEIEPRYQEDFFIEQHLVNNGELWERGYEVDIARLPEFITLRLANEIMIIGKTVSFMRKVCDEPKESFLSLARRLEDYSLTFGSVVDGSFEEVIHTLYTTQSDHLLQVLNDRFSLKLHLRAFKDYFLLTRGEFIFSFLKKAKLLLDGPASLLNRRDLRDMYLDSMHIPPAKLVTDEILNRLDVELSVGSKGDLGWDVFSLDYILTPPLDTVFPPSVFSCYQSIFRFVLMIRNCEYIILNLWLLLNRYNHPSREDFDLPELFYLSHFFISSLLHFIRKLEYYISYDIFACEWESLLQAVDECRDLDHLRASHRHYLDLLKIGCFISPIQKEFNSDFFRSNNLEILKELNSIFQALENNIKLAEKTFREMFSHLDVELAAKRVAEERINSSTWGMSDSLEQKEFERENEFTNKMEFTKQTLQIQYNKFNLAVQSFVMHIYKNPIFNLKKLAVCLNYSGFYRLNTFINLSIVNK